jgi:hypothetical protein
VNIGLSEAQRATLHDRADSYDIDALSREPVMDRYALRGDFGPGGTIWVEVSGAQVPGALRNLAWTEFGVVAYALRWDPLNPADLLVEFPTPAGRAERAAAATMLGRVALAIHEATGIEILDADAFPVARGDL